MKEKKQAPVEYFFIFIKAYLMGVADIIPGVSGGTIAFITGIYDRLIHGIRNIGDFIKEFFEKVFGKKKSWKSIFGLIDFSFFIPLVLGIWMAFLTLAQIIPGLLIVYPAPVMSLFVGLILSSTVLIHRDIKTHGTKGYVFAILTFVIGLWISWMAFHVVDSSIDPGYFYIFFLGMISICAMILPGISGAYILFAFGQYEFMVGTLADIANKYTYILTFMAGGAIGLLLFSRVLSYLLKKHHSMTLYGLIGLMLGALLGPILRIIANLNSEKTVFYSVLMFIIGAILVFALYRFSKRKKI